MIRAKMCEQLAKLMQQSNSATFFTVGLLSVLDAFMDRPMPESSRRFPWRMKSSGLCWPTEGVFGVTLRCVLAYERGDWEAVQTLSDAHVICSSRPILKPSCGQPKCVTLFKFLRGMSMAPRKASEIFVELFDVYVNGLAMTA